VVFLPHLPEPANNAPLALVAAPNNAQPVPVDTNTSEGTPSLAHATVKVVIEMVAPVKMPVLTHQNPFGASPSLQDA